MPAQIRNLVPLLVGAVLALQMLGCATGKPADSALRLQESTLEVRSVQTRKLAAPSETAILAATIAVLQDLEFNIDRIEKPLGVISASKISDADHEGEKAGLFFLDLACALGGSPCNYLSTAKDDQTLLVTVVVLPSLERDGEYAVRATIQRIIYDKMDRIRVLERIADPVVFEDFFASLRTALFLEVNES